MKKLLETMRQKPEHHKRAISFGLSLVITLVIALGWAGQRGILGGEGEGMAEAPKIVPTKQTASVALAPVESSKRSLTSGLESAKQAYLNFKESLANVLVPFVTGIEVYERK